MIDKPPSEIIYRPGIPPAEGGRPEHGYRVIHDQGMVIERDVPITLRDGVKLFADVYRPEGNDEPLPALFEWGPYGKNFPAYEIYARFPGCGVKLEWLNKEYVVFEGPDPTWWCPRGYAIVNVDPRGTWYSEGKATYWDQTQEAHDCYDAIEWAGTQPWSNGKVGMTGVSYLAGIQWFVGALAPPHLAAINPWEGVSDMYREYFLHGGIPDTFFPQHWQENVSFSTTEVEDTIAMTREHPLFDSYWETKAAQLSKVTVPAYVVASWTDHALHTRGTLEGFKQLASEQKWLEIHGRKKWEYYHQPTSVEKQMRFFDHFLKGVDNDVTSWPKVLLEIREKAYVGEWHEEKEWPLARTDYQPLYLDARSGSLSRSPAGAEAEVRYDATAAGARAVFDYHVDEDTDLVGYLKLKLWVEAVGADDMDLFAGIQRLDRDGNVVPFPFYAALDDGNVALGWLRVSHRELDTERSTPSQPWHTHRREDKLERGVVVPVEIEIWPTGTRFLAGETLRVIVQGRDIYDYPSSVIISRHEDTRNAGSHVIRTGGKFDSHLLIPVLPR
jgi:uncharacterized protein